MSAQPGRRGPDPLPPMERMMRRTLTDEASGCWLWQGAISTETGYGRIRVGSRVNDSVKTVQVHRLSYELHVGPIPEGLDLDHLCRVRHCLNPKHLEPVTRRTNSHRGLSAPKPTCFRNHPEDRQSISKTGRRVCLDCGLIRTAARKARRVSNNV